MDHSVVSLPTVLPAAGSQSIHLVHHWCILHKITLIPKVTFSTPQF